MPGRFDHGRVAVVEGQGHPRRAAPGELQLVELPGLRAGQARLDRVRLAGEVGDDRVPEAERVEPEGRFLLRGVADGRPDRRGEQPLALGVEQAVVVVGGDLAAAEDDDAPPCLR